MPVFTLTVPSSFQLIKVPCEVNSVSVALNPLPAYLIVFPSTAEINVSAELFSIKLKLNIIDVNEVVPHIYIL